MRLRIAAVVVLAAVLAGASAGCSNDRGAEGGDPATASTTPDAGAGPGGETADPGAGPPDREAPATAFNEEDAGGTIDCAGQDVAVNGERADLHLTGRCGTVVVNGAHARVVIDDADLIVVNGEEAAVTYGGEPEVVRNGERATVEQK